MSSSGTDLPLKDIVGLPVSSCIKAQAKVGDAMFDYVRSVGFKHSQQYLGLFDMAYVTFVFKQDGLNKILRVPLLTLVPIKPLIIEQVNLKYTLNINNDSEGKIQANFGNKTGNGWGYNEATRYAGQMGMNIKLQQCGIPLGLQKVLKLAVDNGIYTKPFSPKDYRPYEEEHVQGICNILDDIRNYKEEKEAAAKKKAEEEAAAKMKAEEEAIAKKNATVVFIVDDILSIQGSGTAVTGMIRTGTLKVNDYIVIISNTNKINTKIASITLSDKSVETAEKGDSIRILLTNVQKSYVSKGALLTRSQDDLAYAQIVKQREDAIDAIKKAEEEAAAARKKAEEEAKKKAEEEAAKKAATVVFIVEGVSTITGSGTAVTGRMRAGTLKVNDYIYIISDTKKVTTKVASITLSNKSVQSAVKDNTISILLTNVQKDYVSVGALVTRTQDDLTYAQELKKAEDAADAKIKAEQEAAKKKAEEEAAKKKAEQEAAAKKAATVVFIVESISTITGKGTAVTGRMRAGTLKVNDYIYIISGTKKVTTKVASITLSNKSVQSAVKGNTISILLTNVQKDYVSVGALVTRTQDDLTYAQELKKAEDAADAKNKAEQEAAAKKAATVVFIVEGVSTITGKGTAVTGKMRSGTLKVNDYIYIISDTKKVTTKVASITLDNKSVQSAVKGNTISILLTNVQKDYVSVGALVTRTQDDLTYAQELKKAEDEADAKKKTVQATATKTNTETAVANKEKVTATISKEKLDALKASLLNRKKR